MVKYRPNKALVATIAAGLDGLVEPRVTDSPFSEVSSLPSPGTLVISSLPFTDTVPLLMIALPPAAGTPGTPSGAVHCEDANQSPVLPIQVKVFAATVSPQRDQLPSGTVIVFRSN